MTRRVAAKARANAGIAGGDLDAIGITNQRETVVAWDRPDCYGRACKRVDSRDPSTKSVFNVTRNMPVALAEVIRSLHARFVVVSHNNEAWMTARELAAACACHGYVATLAFRFQAIRGCTDWDLQSQR